MTHTPEDPILVWGRMLRPPPCVAVRQAAMLETCFGSRFIARLKFVFTGHGCRHNDHDAGSCDVKKVAVR